MSFARKGTILSLVVVANFVAAWGLRCGVSRPLADQLVESLLVVVLGVSVFWMVRRRYWVLLIVPAAVFGFVYGDWWAIHQMQCGWIACR